MRAASAAQQRLRAGATRRIAGARAAPLPRALAAGRPRRARALATVALLDYVASASDDGPLSLPARTELDASEVKVVFGYPR